MTHPVGLERARILKALEAAGLTKSTPDRAQALLFIAVGEVARYVDIDTMTAMFIGYARASYQWLEESKGSGLVGPDGRRL